MFKDRKRQCQSAPTMLLPLSLSHSQQKLVYYSASTMVGPNNKKASFEVKICHAAHSASVSSP